MEQLLEAWQLLCFSVSEAQMVVMLKGTRALINSTAVGSGGSGVRLASLTFGAGWGMGSTYSDSREEV